MLKADFQADDLTIFKRFRVIFSLKKKNYPISAFVQFLFSTKKSPKVVNLPLTDEMLCLTSQTGQMAFPIFKVIIR